MFLYIPRSLAVIIGTVREGGHRTATLEARADS